MAAAFAATRAQAAATALPPQQCTYAPPAAPEIVLRMPAGAGRLSAHCERLAPFVSAAQPRAIAQALSAARLFRRVDCAPPAYEGAPVVCALQPHRVVKDYRLRGHWPISLFGDDLRRRISLRSGTRIDEPSTAYGQQADRLRVYLEQEGYIDAAVSVDAYPVVSDGLEEALHIEVGVNAKQALQVRHIELRGDTVLPTERLAAPFFHRGWFGWQGRFRPASLSDDIERVSERLAQAGYVGSRIEVHTDKHPEAGAVDLVLEIHAGRRARIEVTGQGPLSARKVRGLAPFVLTGSVDGVAADAYREALHRAYQERGYADARVQVSLLPADDNAVVVRVDIEAGRRSSVREISFRGVSGPTLQAALDSVNLTQHRDGKLWRHRWVDAYVAHDAEQLAAAFAQLGYEDAAVTPERIDDGDVQRLQYNVVLGTRERVGALRFVHLPAGIDGNPLLDHLACRPGAPFSREALERDRQQMLLALLRHGYTDAEVQASFVPSRPPRAVAPVDNARRAPTRTLDVSFTFSHRARARYAGLLPSGNFRTRESTLWRELPFRLQQPLDLVGIGAARRSLRGLSIFHNVTLTPERPLAGDARTWLKLHLEERDVRTLDGLIGFSSDYWFSIGADLRDANVLGRAIMLNMQARLSNASELLPRVRIGNQDLLQLDLRAPHPLGLPLSVEGQAIFRLQDVREYRERRIGGTVAVSRPILARQRCDACMDVSVRLAYELLEAYRVDKEAGAPTQVTNDATIARLVPSLEADRRDSSIDPQRGVHLSLRIEGAHPALAPSAFLHRRATRFWRVLAAGQVFVPLGTPVLVPLRHGRSLGGPVVLAGSVSYGVAQPYGPTDSAQSAVPPSETFGYGGDLSVRGLYARASTNQLANPLFLTVASAELRVYVMQGFGIGSVQLAGFVDAGTVAMRVGDLFRQTTLSAGPALRYVTPVGPLSLAYGRAVLLPRALRGGAEGAPRHGRVHFTFGYTF